MITPKNILKRSFLTKGNNSKLYLSMKFKVYILQGSLNYNSLKYSNKIIVTKGNNSKLYLSMKFQVFILQGCGIITPKHILIRLL